MAKIKNVVTKPKGAEQMQAMPKMINSKDTEVEQEDLMNDYKAKDDFEAFMKVHHIMGDKKRLDKVHALAGRHSKAIKSIKDLKDHYQMKFGAKDAKNLDDPDDDMEDMGE